MKVTHTKPGGKQGIGTHQQEESRFRGLLNQNAYLGE